MRTVTPLSRPSASEEELFTLLHAELRRMAASYLQHERIDHTLQPTALVNEVYLRLTGSSANWQNRAHFFGAAARAMRQILVDHARNRHREKRHGDRVRVEFDERLTVTEMDPANLIALNDALDRLRKLDERCVRVVELRFFIGMSVDEAAELMSVSSKTVDRDWKFARAWLEQQLRSTLS